MGETGDRLETDFLRPGRASPAELTVAVEELANHPATDALLNTLGGVLMILNEQRQIVAWNTHLLKLAQVDDPAEVIGLRPGECLGCIFVDEALEGCGTGKLCRTCGAAIAIVTSQNEERACERECVVTRRVAGQEETIELRVRATPLHGERGYYSVVTLQDVSREKRCYSLQRAFFHDVNNLGAALLLALEELGDDLPATSAEPLARVGRVADRLIAEVKTQRALLELQSGDYELVQRPIALGQVCFEALSAVTGRAEELEVELERAEQPPPATLLTEPQLLNRVLSNMLLNAVEATEPGGRVSLTCTVEEEEVLFAVWNAAHLPEEILRRVFQRSFTTKGGPGRGVGGFSMKLIGERYLRGTVHIESSAAGTVASIRLPLRPPG